MTMATSRKAARSGKMECPICEQKKLLVLHHINGRNIPEKNRKFNLAYICAACHDSVHSQHPNRIVIEGWISTTEGLKLAWRRAGEPQDCMEGARPHLYSSGG